MNITTEQYNVLARYEYYLGRTDEPKSNWLQIELGKGEQTIHEICNFTTRDEYLAWVAQWKAEYTRLTKEIRHLKRSRKLSSPTYNPMARDLAMTYGWHATVLLFIRQYGKVRAARLRQERIEKEKAVKA